MDKEQFSGVRLDNMAVVLHRPRRPENIGAAARAMCNMGISRLVVVSPENCDLKRVMALATHAAVEVVENMYCHDRLDDALAPFNYVVGTTARRGGERKVLVSPTQMAERLVPISQDNQVALLFGPEDRGLSNEEIRPCHLLVNIPTSGFSSLNLSQAVMVLCYELFRTGIPAPQAGTPRFATRTELDLMYEQIKDILVRINYIQPENPDYWMNKLRHYFNRIQLRAGEVSMIRGIGRQIQWYAGKCYRDGARGEPPPFSSEKDRTS
jgi:tRNA/rRNA methyltransferase